MDRVSGSFRDPSGTVFKDKDRIIRSVSKLGVEKYLFIKKNNIIETIPGYYHDIKNISKNEAIVLLWSNQLFNIKKPDTISINYEKI